MITDYFSSLKGLDKPNDHVRDLYQLLLIGKIFESKYRQKIVLKGLTALNLAYGIGTGDNKIELSALEEIYPREFLALIKRIVKLFPTLKVSVISDKRYLYSIKIEITENESPIFIEITKIKYNWQRGTNFDVKSLESKGWSHKVLAYVVQLSEIVNKHSADNPEISRIRL